MQGKARPAALAIDHLVLQIRLFARDDRANHDPPDRQMSQGNPGEKRRNEKGADHEAQRQKKKIRAGVDRRDEDEAGDAQEEQARGGDCVVAKHREKGPRGRAYKGSSVQGGEETRRQGDTLHAASLIRVISTLVPLKPFTRASTVLTPGSESSASPVPVPASRSADPRSTCDFS